VELVVAKGVQKTAVVEVTHSWLLLQAIQKLDFHDMNFQMLAAAAALAQIHAHSNSCSLKFMPTRFLTVKQLLEQHAFPNLVLSSPEQLPEHTQLDLQAVQLLPSVLLQLQQQTHTLERHQKNRCLQHKYNSAMHES
jgi:hypothetical protein